jgi:hypothetical protein
MGEILPVGILKALATHAKKLGVFQSVMQYEPTTELPLGEAVTLAVWGGPIRPVITSGLDAFSWRVEIVGRIFTNSMAKPMDRIDPRLFRATSVFLSSLAGNFDLGGQIRHVDFLGSSGDGVNGTPGYVEISGKHYRIMDLRIPLILNDVMDMGN